MWPVLPSLVQRASSALGRGAPAFPSDEPLAAQRMAQLAEVWVAQVSSASRHGTESADALTQVFVGMERQLAQVVEATQDAVGALQADGGNSLSGAVLQAKQRMEHVIGMIEEAVSANHLLFGAVAEVVHAVSQLEDTAESVQKISNMTSLLAINARIEAARAGAAGVGFAVVANEVKRLAEQSRLDSEAIMERVKHIDTLVRATTDRVEAVKANDHQLILKSRVEVSKVIDDLGAPMSQLMETSQALCEIGAATRGSVADALIRLQFQDRVSQRLDHVSSNVAAFAVDLARAWPGTEAVEALDGRLRDSYTMPEELQTHHKDAELAQAAPDLVLF